MYRCPLIGPTVLLAALACSGCGSGETTEPPRRTVLPPKPTPALHRLLSHGDRHYDPSEQMLVAEFDSPGYHTRIASGARVHPTRESLIYALALLQRNGNGDVDRATAIVRRVVLLQDVDPDSPTCGVWPWQLEEPLAEMRTPDHNWADFCGSQLAHLMVEQLDRFPRDLIEPMCVSLHLAADAIRSRNVGPGYTNIAILGGAVCVVAGELFDDDEMLAYGRERLEGVVNHVEQNGGFSEYNSPPYSKVIIGECERLLHLARDPASRRAAESLRLRCWQEIADSFHPATQQWAGPHSRNSEVYLQSKTVEFLSLRTGVAIDTHPAMLSDNRPGRYATVPPLPCPADLLSRFRKPVEKPLEIRRVFARDKSGEPSIVGTTWHAPEACLGSVNRAGLWTQRKPLIAYWKTADDPAVVFRVRFLHDGRDFASMGIRTAQQQNRVLCLFESLSNRGDWHRTLDRPADGVFEATDLPLRFELIGTGASAESLGDGRYALSAGEYRVVIHTVPGQFNGHDVAWQIGDDGRSVEGICYEGEKRGFDFSKPPDVRLCAGIELLSSEVSPSKSPPQLVKVTPGSVSAVWDELRVSTADED